VPSNVHTPPVESTTWEPRVPFALGAEVPVLPVDEPLPLEVPVDEPVPLEVPDEEPVPDDPVLVPLLPEELPVIAVTLAATYDQPSFHLNTPPVVMTCTAPLK
jgi:hypothetical protein